MAAMVIAVLAVPALPAVADDHGKLRMYKMNSKGQLNRQKWLKDTEKPGCHNTLKARKVHRVAQVGFKWCKIYEQEDCTKGTAVKATWGGDKYKDAPFDFAKPQLKLVKGTEWILDPEGNVTIRSWKCIYEQEQG